MYRTDKQFLKNPATVSSRIYVGNLVLGVVADDLDKIFSQHGKITGLSCNNKFAFVQFEHDYEAQLAIQKVNGTMLNGRKLVVKQAFTPGGNPSNQPWTPQSKVGTPGPPNIHLRQPPPLMGGSLKLDISPKQNNSILHQTPPPSINQNEHDFQDENLEDDRPNIRPPGPNPLSDDRGRKDMRKPVRGSGVGGRGRSNDRFNDRYEGPPVDNYRDPPFYERDDPDFGAPRNESFTAPSALEKNDCEIIVVAKGLTEYAEFIEQKLKKLGLIVDLLFPNEDVPIGKVLANISSRGCLYAILVMPINEEHRSLTLNILHSTPQEHRNIPLEDALILISRNFEAYMKGELAAPDQSAQLLLNDRHPVAMQMLLNLLAENRQLTSTQYDRLIKYLEERRELQHQFEVAEGITVDSQDGDSKQAELQNRIMNILNNKASETPIPTSITAPSVPVSNESTPILKDPTVQKALDSLMLGDMFKSIAGAD